MSDTNYTDRVRKSLQSNFRFILRINDIPFAMVSEVSRPTPSFGSPKEYQLLNWKFKQPSGVVTWSDVTFRLVESFDSLQEDTIAGKILNTYKKLSYDNPDRVSPGVKPKDMNKKQLIESIGTVKIETIDPDGVVYETWKLYNAFVSKISFDGLKYSGASLIGASLTLTYDWADLTYTNSAGREKTY